MEDTMLALVLFVLSFSFYYWLITPMPSYSSEAWELNDDGKIVIGTHTITPIEQQLHDLWCDDEPLLTPPDCIHVDALKLREARKIASMLGIKQKVNGKDQPKQWLVAQIKTYLEHEPQETAHVIERVTA